MAVDQVYCVSDYWLDYPRKDRVRIDNCVLLSEENKVTIRLGKMVAKPDRDGTYTQYFCPIKYDSIEDKEWALQNYTKMMNMWEVS